MTGLGTKIKTALRISDATLDGEIEDMIEEAQEDMMRLGIAEIAVSGTALGRKAVIAYCKSRYATDMSERDAYYGAYRDTVDEMRRTTAYRAGEDAT